MGRGPCKRESKIHVYPMREDHHHSDCMQHCEKLGGRSPPVRTFDEWQNFVEEVQHMKRVPQNALWLSATEGKKKGNSLERLLHWRED